MLTEVGFTGVRNLAPGLLSLSTGFNLIVGGNAAGKTSVLEAVYLLGRGKSFRARRLEQVRTQGSPLLRVTGRIRLGEGCHHVGLEYDAGGIRARMDRQDVRVLSDLAAMLPLQVINTETQRILQDGPPARRAWLNWGCFHLDPGYHAHWQRYERALRQRNAALRVHDGRLARAWEMELTEAADSLDASRGATVGATQARLEPLLTDWLPSVEIVIDYRRGWRAGSSLAECFDAGRERELESGYTLYGPHRADVSLRANGVEAQFVLSRGQQKLLGIALVMAQGQAVALGSRVPPVMLVDDLAAELDGGHCEAVIHALGKLGSQVLLTAITRDSLPLSTIPERSYAVAEGRFREMIY